MRASASVGRVVGAGVVGVVRPMVFVDGVVESRLSVREFVCEGVLDERRVEMIVVGDVGLLSRWMGRLAVVALPCRLSDGQVRWGVLAAGRISGRERGVSVRRDEVGLVVRDGWGLRMGERLGGVWGERDGGLVADSVDGARLEVGDRSNRSTARWELNGERVFVPSEGDGRWTVGDALAYLSAAGGLGLSLRWLPGEVVGMVLGGVVRLDGVIGRVLGGLLEDYGLVVQREMVFHGGRVSERRAVRPAESGRRVVLDWGAGDVAEMSSGGAIGGAERWVAVGGGWLVESTFELVHGWDSGLEGGADSLYSKGGSTDFAAYANVYRSWVLNEDGAFSGAPYEQGGRYDLSALFGGGEGVVGTVRFERCVTLDDSGGRRAVSVEVSTDDGVTWSVYSGVARVRTDRAGVYLDDGDLPVAFLGAAKAGAARVRVTAGVRSPIGVKVARWTGNPFLGVGVGDEGADRVLDVGRAFSFARVDSGSVHFDGVRSGVLESREADQTAEMTRWLVGRMRRAGRGGVSGGGGRARVRLVGSRPMLRVGDRVVNGGGAGLSYGGESEGLCGAVGRVVRVKCVWDVGGGEVVAGRGYGTAVDVVYG